MSALRQPSGRRRRDGEGRALDPLEPMPPAPPGEQPRIGGVAIRGARAAEIVRFGLAGLVNTLFGFAVYAGLVLLGLDPPLALGLATMAGVFFNFLTYGSFAFRRLEVRRLPRFLLAYGAIYLLNLALLETLRGAIGLGPLEAQLACLAVVAPTAYVVLGSKVFQSVRA